VNVAVTGPVIVGRAPGADIVIAAGYVSGRHAKFQVMGQNLFVEDLGSTNGTCVNGQQISAPCALKSGDVVNVGDVSIRVRFE
jgi:pSer/pThr/pTyr-binding forkhead associated (FHA) protein